ncbi:MAG TPA: hypothetical protein VHX65_17775 [Pirellulales bacterium]|jgi:hypothetical protein|nr:hypothetical protein [Pirellulales bacterium]
MHRFRLAVAAAISTCVLAVASAASARPPIDLVLLADSSPAVARSAQHWATTFSTLGIAGVQIRSARPGETVGVETLGSPDSPSYHVIGKLAGDELILPGGQFGIHDTQQLGKWLDELGKHGSAGVTEKTGAFGLLPKQTAMARDGLTATVDLATKGVAASEAFDKIGKTLKYPLSIDADIQQAIAADDPVRDELQGLSAGTALAALARPLGAVLRPRETAGGSLEYTLTKGAVGQEAWPIGWPPEQAEGKIIPTLLESHNVEIRDIPLSQAAAAIQALFKVPFLWDHNSILKQRVDLEKKVSFPARKTYYVTVLRHLLSQDDLRYVVRVDENGKPLVWITTFKAK